ncbi:MAG TPA: site-specific DNA-methyltransferase [Ruminococcus flavefaciens]|mgnify:CR=1 FL=1|nr:site-specific DNA-methyltransferase [Ruminococcus flavefaciens]
MANLSQERRERMLAFLQTLKAQHTDDDSLMALGEIEKELKAKKYGLVWEEHEEEVDVKMRTHIPVFTVDEDMEIDGDPSSERFNFLLEGDNLHSLRLLEKTHRGRIDVIYIDPPYNTGKSFTYADKTVESSDAFRHSKWLSFMRERLSIASKLLSDKGVIFISINDAEEAQLKLLCDEVFGEANFVAVMPKKGSGGRQDSRYFAIVHEYVLCYAKQIDCYEAGRDTKSESDSKYNLIDENGNPYKLQLLRKWGDNSRRENRPNLFYPIYFSPKTHTLDIERQSEQDIEIFPMLSATEEGCWRWGKPTMLENMRNHKVEIKKTKGEYIPYERLYKPAEPETKPFTTWIDDTDNSTGSALLKSLLGSDLFDYPKPLDLIIKILKMSSMSKDYTVLDFFAGSGTTGQAVMELNQQDGGNRRFILCTNNENGICENVTYQRLKTVITGKRPDGSEYSGGIPANLMYFRTDFVDKESEELSEELLEHIREMIQLEHGIKIDDQKYVIIMDDEEMDAFEQNFSSYTQLKAVFINQDVFLSSSQEEMLEKVDSYIIPDYYFDFELREAGEIW